MKRTVKPAGPTFWRLDAHIGWRQSTSSHDVFYDDVIGALRLGDENTTAISPTEPGGTFGGITKPTGLAVGSDGWLVLADPSNNQLLGYSTGTIVRPTGLAVGHDSHLFLIDPANENFPKETIDGVTRPTGLSLGKTGLELPFFPDGKQVDSEKIYSEAFKPFTPLWSPCMAAPPAPCSLDEARQDIFMDPYALHKPRGVTFSPEGDLVVADTGNGRVLIYTWPQLVTRYIIPLPGGEPWDLDYDSRGRLYVADAAAKRVYRFDRLWRLDTDYLGGDGVLKQPHHLAIDGGDQLFVLDDVARRVVALDDKGTLMPEDDDRLRKTPLHRRVFPRALRLENGTLWLPQDTRPNCPALPLPSLAVDRRGRWAGSTLLLLAQPQGLRYPRVGHYISTALDSKIFNCRWHRLVFDADIPEGTIIAVRTLTASTELEPARMAALPDDRWSVELIITPDDQPEVLIQSPPGQYLWLKVELNGNGQVTPLIRSMVLYAPRQSSLEYLPPVFREDADSAYFLERFLSYFDTVFEEIESQIDRFTGYLDPDGVPSGEFLTWLGSWLDLDFLAQWPDKTRREFVRQAIALYKLRGTVLGLQKVLRLHTGLQPPQPIIIEHFRMRGYGSRHTVRGLVDGKPYLAGHTFLPDAEEEIAHHFTVVLPDRAVPDADALETIRHLIDAQKPAHTQYEIRVVHPGLRIGCQSTVGVDALIGPYPSAPLGQLKLAQSGQLAPSRPRLGYERLSFHT